MSNMLNRLESLGVVQTVDAALGRLLASKSANEGETIGIAAALASAALAQGHSCLPLAALHEFVVARLIDDPRAGDTLLGELPSTHTFRETLIASPLVARGGIPSAALVFDVHERIYLRRYFNYEHGVAQALLRRLSNEGETPPNAAALRAILARHFDGSLGDEQRIAVLLALRSRFLIVSGGPGAGKTSTVLRLLAITIEQALAAARSAPRIALTAPTGKAAARLSETLRAPSLAIDADVHAALPSTATTLHRLLGVMPGRAKPRYDRTNPLPYDLVVVDEASMLDLALAARLCDALSPQTRLILLGDRDQLASVEAGSVFGALCAAAGEANRYSPASARWLQSILGESGAADDRGSLVESGASAAATQSRRDESRPYESAATHPLGDAVVELRGSHRFGSHSRIGRFARAVRIGNGSDAQKILGDGSGELNATSVAENALTQIILTQVLPRFALLAAIQSPAAALDYMDRVRVLCALRNGPFGAVTINATIEHELRRRSAHVDAQGWFPGRLVMIASNDYRQDLFNGDIGVALPTGTGGAIELWFRSADGTPRALPPALLPAHESAFALTVHKAQGSEFDEVLIVLPTRDARVLTRELLYTAVTRARKKVELWTSGEILAATIARSTQRWSGLADALQKANLA